MKNEIKPLNTNVILKPYSINPYLALETASGFKLADGNFDNPDSGEHDILDKMIACGEVIEVGPNCKDVKVGDDAFYDVRTVRPLPFKRQGFVVVSENGILTIMNNNLEERFLNIT